MFLLFSHGFISNTTVSPQAMLRFSKLLLVLLVMHTPTTCAFEVHLNSSHLEKTIVNSTLPGQGWSYIIGTKFGRRSLPFITIETLGIHSGVVQQARKFNCRKTKTDFLEFSVISKKEIFSTNLLKAKVFCTIPYSVYIHGRKCKYLHKKWPWKRLTDRAHNKHKVDIQLPPSHNCFIQETTVLSLYDVIPTHFHSCNITAMPFNLNVDINQISLDLSFTENICLDNAFELDIQLFLRCPNSHRQLLPYVITFHKEAEDVIISDSSLRRQKRQNANRAPTFSSLQYTAHVKEEQEPGVSVITIAATDPDNGDAGVLIYRMEATEDLRSQDMFIMDPSTGLIKTKQILDRETMAKHSFIIYATDNALPVSERKSATTYLSIIVDDVNDHTPTFQSSSARIVIFENRPPGQEEYAATVVDEDTGDNAVIRYSILNPGPPNDAFMINPQTGIFTTRQPLDRERMSSYRVLIQAMDQGDLNDRKSSTLTLSISVGDENDNAPVFLKDSYTVSLREDQQPSTTKEIINVTAVDADTGDNGYVVYRLSSSGQNTFSINNLTGQLFLIGPLNYESTHEYSLNVFAEDKGTLSKRNSITVIVKVIDINNNRPIFLHPAYYSIIDENIARDTNILQVQAEDKDSGENGLLTYSVVNNTDLLPFAINSKTGMISTIALIDNETQTIYSLQIKAQDSGDPPLSATVNVSIAVVRYATDKSPVF